ncbi:hypothetical protein QBC40DRAFT_237769 [Triangularia verruculosa]|uniref:Uncharacterized protein n=1 Tax=Triangularia verruculosa TaxID=2587418 RepID=A0AAN7APY8_9PEZI|nr:hypothetical protein QBC40DRAFT_237769 [Triangularia verruculosa]
MGRQHGPCYMCKEKGWHRAFLPMLLSLGAFICGIMALFAGRSWNIMEDYELMLLKTVVLTDWAKSNSHLTDPTLVSLHIGAHNAAVKDKPRNELKKDQLKDNPLPLKRVGPPYDFYSLHGTGICMSWYSPRPDDPNPYREVQNYGLDLYELLVRHTNGTIANLSGAGNVKADLKNLYGAHKTFTLMFTIAVGFYGIFAFFTTWFAVYNPRMHRSHAKNRHKIIIWFHWITSLICGTLALLSGGVGATMTSIAVNQLNGHWGAHHIEASMGMKWIPVMLSSVGMMVVVWVWWNWMWMRLLGIRMI